MSAINELFSTILGSREDSEEDPGGGGNNPSTSDLEPYIYDGTIPKTGPRMGKRASEQVAKTFVLDKFVKRIEENRNKKGNSDDGKSDEDSSGIATGATSGSDRKDSENSKQSEEETTFSDIDNGYESTRPKNLKRDKKISLNRGNKDGKDLLWDLARGISQDSGDVPTGNKMQGLFKDMKEDAKIRIAEEDELDVDFDPDLKDKDDTASSAEGEKNPDDSWDAFFVVNTEESNLKREARIALCHKVFKLAAIVSSFIFILGGTIITKMTVLLTASNIKHNMTMHCVFYHDYTVGGVVTDRYARCMIPSLNYTPTYNETCLGPASSGHSRDYHGAYPVCTSVAVRWIWCLLLILVTPELFVFLRSLWTIGFKKEKRPPSKVFWTVLLFECLQTVGVCLFAFRVLPKLQSIIHGMALMAGVAFVPSLLKLVSRPKTERHRPLKIALDLLAVLAQGSALFLWPVVFYLRTEQDHEPIYTIPISLFLMSLTFWFNYIDETNISKRRKFRDDPNLGWSIKFRTEVFRFKKKLAKCRPKTYVLVSLVKIVLIFGCMVGFMYGDFGIDALFDFENKHDSCPSNGIGIFDIYGAEFDWIGMWLVSVLAGMITYTFARTAAKVQIQAISYAVPLTLVTPVLIPVLLGVTTVWQHDPCFMSPVMPAHIYWNFPVRELVDVFTKGHLGFVYIWWLAQFWLTLHIWKPKCERLAKTSKIFLLPLWNNVVIEQWLLYNRSRNDKGKATGDTLLKKDGGEQLGRSMLMDEENMTPEQIRIHDQTPMVYICATMWHENETEMMLMLKSIFKLDVDQCIRRNVQTHLGVTDPDFYNFEAHIFFDDAMEAHADEEYDYKVNSFVQLLVDTMDAGAAAIHGLNIRIPAPTRYPTPYGGRLEWSCPGGNKIVAHLKDKTKIRHKKRWSQVMYMYYFLGYRLWSKEPNLRRRQDKADNTFLLALDGDVDFEPKAMLLLVDLLRKDPKVGAACGRIHPTGSGPMVWYQKFEYAMGHWMQKATEHVLGCVLCSPGCFSMFRGSALMDDNVMKMYTTTATEARHYVQYDQGEDRWLCTLMLQQGYRVEYSAASDAFTFAPEGFNEFYNQRRRWGPSTMANIMDLISSWSTTIDNNQNISTLYMMYQTFLFVSSLVGIGTIFLMIVGALEVALAGALNSWESFSVNLIPVIGFIILCYLAKSETQLFVASILTVMYALLQMLVMVGIIIQITEEGPCSPNAIFFFFVAGTFVLAGILHPQEFFCLVHGFLYFLSIPSMYMLLMIYALTNLHVVSWGTREVKTTKTEKEEQEQKEREIAAKQAEKKGNAALSSLLKYVNLNATNNREEGFTVGIGDLFRCVCCPRPAENPVTAEFKQVQRELVDTKKLLLELKKDMKGLKKENDVSGKKQRLSVASVDSFQDLSETAPLLEEIPEEDPIVNTVNEQQAVMEKILEEIKQESEDENQEDVEKINELENPLWIRDEGLGDGSLVQLPPQEIEFFQGLIEKYLKPLEKDAKREERVAMELKELRNTMSFAYFLLNAIFVVFVFSMQQNTDKVSIPWPCGQNLRLEPIGFMFLIIYGVIIFIQMLGMLFHRAETFNHIVATTSLGGAGNKNDEMTRMFISDAIELTRNFGHLDDDDRSSIASGISEFDPEDSNRPQKIKQTTVYKIAKHRKKTAAPPQTLDKKIGQGFQKLLSQLDEGDNDEDEEKSAEKIFKNMTRVRKIQGTGHKKSIAAIANLRRRTQGSRVRTQSSSSFMLGEARTEDEIMDMPRNRKFNKKIPSLNKMFPQEGMTNPAYERDDPLNGSSRSVQFSQQAGDQKVDSSQFEMKNVRRSHWDSQSETSDSQDSSDSENEADYPSNPGVNQSQVFFNSPDWVDRSGGGNKTQL